MRHTTVRIRPARAAKAQEVGAKLDGVLRQYVEVTYVGETIAFVRCLVNRVEVMWLEKGFEEQHVVGIVRAYRTMHGAQQREQVAA